MEGQKLERSIGLGGAAATLVGYVVGASIFILPGELAASTGPAIFLSFLLASIPALLSCFVTAQIGCVYPVSGGPYIAASRNLSPFAGFMLVWSLMLGATIGIPLIAYGFADYLAFFIPGVPQMVVALGIVASLISFGALFAAATSVNGILLAISRDIYALARDQIFPEALGRLGGQKHMPHAAILTVTLLGLIGISRGASITQYALSAVMAIMLVQILSAAAVFALPRKRPERFAAAGFRLSPFWRVFVAWASFFFRSDSSGSVSLRVAPQ